MELSGRVVASHVQDSEQSQKGLMENFRDSVVNHLLRMHKPALDLSPGTENKNKIRYFKCAFNILISLNFTWTKSPPYEVILKNQEGIFHSNLYFTVLKQSGFVAVCLFVLFYNTGD
jgi:hypothetical protein